MVKQRKNYHTRKQRNQRNQRNQYKTTRSFRRIQGGAWYNPRSWLPNSSSAEVHPEPQSQTQNWILKPVINRGVIELAEKARLGADEAVSEYVRNMKHTLNLPPLANGSKRPFTPVAQKFVIGAYIQKYGKLHSDNFYKKLYDIIDETNENLNRTN